MIENGGYPKWINPWLFFDREWWMNMIIILLNWVPKMIQHGDIMEKRKGDLFAYKKKDGLTNKNGIHQYTHFCLIEWSVLWNESKTVGWGQNFARNLDIKSYPISSQSRQKKASSNPTWEWTEFSLQPTRATKNLMCDGHPKNDSLLDFLRCGHRHLKYGETTEQHNTTE